jgi:hypothetical protein
MQPLDGNSRRADLITMERAYDCRDVLHRFFGIWGRRYADGELAKQNGKETLPVRVKAQQFATRALGSPRSS